MSHLPLIDDLSMHIHFCNNICLWRSLPKSLIFWFGCCDHKSARHIRLPCNFFIFLHQRNINFGIFGNSNSELRIVKPTIIRLLLWMLSHLKDLFCLKISLLCVCKIRTLATICLPRPLAFNWIHLPVLRENFVDGYSIKLNYEVSKAHPPRSIWLFGLDDILDFFFHSFILLPIIGLFAKRSCPHSFVAPWIS